MAGIPAGGSAGRLSIEIVAEIARLQSDLDKAKAAVRAASADFAASGKVANDNIKGLGNTGKLAGYQMQNLAFQFQDLGIQMVQAAQSGHPLKLAMTALMQQGSQISGIMGQAGIGVKGLASEIGGMIGRFAAAHPVLVAFAAIAGTATLALEGFTASINATARKDLDEYAKSLGMTAKEIEAVGGAAVTMGDVFKAVGEVIAQRMAVNVPAAMKTMHSSVTSILASVGSVGMKAAAAMYASWASTIDGLKILWAKFPAIVGDAAFSAANAVIAGLNFLLAKATERLNGMIASVNAVMSLIPGLGGTKIPAIPDMKIPQWNNPFAGAGREAAGAFVGAYKKRYGEAMAAEKSFFADVADESVKNAMERLSGGAKSGSSKAGKAAHAAGKKQADDYMKGFIEGLANLAGTMERYFDAIQKDVLKQVDDNLQTAADEWQNKLKAFADTPRPFELAADQTERWNDELRKTVAIFDDLGAKGVGTFLSILGGIKTGDFSGVGGKTGALAQLLWNQLSPISVGSGIGKDGEHLARTLGDVFENALDKVFGSTGTFTKLLNGAVIGGAVGGGTLGSYIGGAVGQVGSNLLAKTKFGSSTLGSIVGGLLPIVGGLIGGLFKKTTKGSAIITNSGVSTSGNNGDLQSAMSQNGNQIASVLSQMAAAFGSKVGSYAVSIAQRSSGWIHVDSGAAANVGDQNWINKNAATAIYNGKDMTEALKVALRNAIEDGAIAGMTATEKAIALASPDIEAGMARALTFHNAFEELRQQTDPAAYELEKLAKQMADLRDIAAEGGATVEELNKLQQLEDIKRKAIVDAEAAKALDMLNERRALEVRLLIAQGDAAGALNLQREVERSQTREDLRDLLDQVNAAEDAQQRQVQLNAARAIEIEILKLQGRATESLALQRQAELEAIDPLNRGLQMTLYAYQDAAEVLAKAQDKVTSAKDALSAAYGRESAAMAEVSAKWKGIGDNIRGFLSSLSGEGLGGAASYRQSLVSYLRVSGGARAGNEADASAFGDTARTFLNASQAQSSTRVQYLRSLAMVRRDAAAAIGVADSQASAAERAAASLKTMVGGLVKLDEDTLTVSQAIALLKDAQAEADAAQMAQAQLADPVPHLEVLNASAAAQVDALADIKEELSRMRAENEQLRATIDGKLGSVVTNTGKTASTLGTWDAGGAAAVTTRSGTSVTTVAA